MKDMKLSHLSTSCLIRSLLRSGWMILLAAWTFSLAAGIYLNTLWTPRYRASMTYAVQPRTASVYGSVSQNAAQEVTAVLESLLPTDLVTRKIRDWHPELADFNGSVSAATAGSSNFIVITCLDDTPDDALMALLALTDLFPELAGYISTDAVTVPIRSPAVSGGMVNAVDVPRVRLQAAIAGGIAMTAWLVWLFLQRDTIQTRSGARSQLDADIIACVGHVRRRIGLHSLLRPAGPVQVFSPAATFAYTEQIASICARLEQEHDSSGAQVFLFTGIDENEGKSTISGNVAAALALRGAMVTVVDCDLRNPSLKRFFDDRYDAKLPLNQLLAAPFSPEKLSDAMVMHDQLGFYMLCSHEADPRCTELLTGRTMAQVLQELRLCDYVILDMPPMGRFADTEAMLDRVDASVLVVRQDRTPACDINDAADLLRSAGSRFLGCVLNDMTGTLTEGYGYGHYGYGYGRYGYGRTHED